MPDLTQPARYRFGVFEADAATGELRKQGIRIKVNVQPFQVLLLLLERPGEILTRDDLARVLWPEGTFVDFEHGVNSAVNRIREALGDSARNPRFIETLARRGYRFIAPVTRTDDAPATTPGAPGLASETAPGAPGLASETWDGGATELAAAPITYLATPAELPRVPARTVRALFLALQLMYVGFYVGALANLPEIEQLLAPLDHARALVLTLTVTAALLIPVRVFLITAMSFRAPGLRAKYLRLWPWLLPFDILWALAPFLLLHHMNVGVATACMAPLVYSPFAQRALILMDSEKADPLRG